MPRFGAASDWCQDWHVGEADGRLPPLHSELSKSCRLIKASASFPHLITL